MPTNPENLLKIGTVAPEGEKLIIKKEKTVAEHVARGHACRTG